MVQGGVRTQAAVTGGRRTQGAVTGGGITLGAVTGGGGTLGPVTGGGKTLGPVTGGLLGAVTGVRRTLVAGGRTLGAVTGEYQHWKLSQVECWGLSQLCWQREERTSQQSELSENQRRSQLHEEFDHGQK